MTIDPLSKDRVKIVITRELLADGIDPKEHRDNELYHFA